MDVDLIKKLNLTTKYVSLLHVFENCQFFVFLETLWSEKMSRLGWFIIIMWLSGCANQSLDSNTVFSNAQVQYQTKERTKISKRSNMEMPSYFFELEYEPTQTSLNKAQINKIQTVFKKLVYPDEYKLYVSFGNGNASQFKSLSPIIKRAEDIKRQYSKKVREVHIVYLKNQKPDCAYFRFLG